MDPLLMEPTRDCEIRVLPNSSCSAFSGSRRHILSYLYSIRYKLSDEPACADLKTFSHFWAFYCHYLTLADRGGLGFVGQRDEVKSPGLLQFFEACCYFFREEELTEYWIRAARSVYANPHCCKRPTRSAATPASRNC
jgi:hypothetical protein